MSEMWIYLFIFIFIDEVFVLNLFFSLDLA